MKLFSSRKFQDDSAAACLQLTAVSLITCNYFSFGTPAGYSVLFFAVQTRPLLSITQNLLELAQKSFSKPSKPLTKYIEDFLVKGQCACGCAASSEVEM